MSIEKFENQPSAEPSDTSRKFNDDAYPMGTKNTLPDFPTVSESFNNPFFSVQSYETKGTPLFIPEDKADNVLQVSSHGWQPKEYYAPGYLENHKDNLATRDLTRYFDKDGTMYVMAFGTAKPSHILKPESVGQDRSNGVHWKYKDGTVLTSNPTFADEGNAGYTVELPDGHTVKFYNDSNKKAEHEYKGPELANGESHEGLTR